MEILHFLVPSGHVSFVRLITSIMSGPNTLKKTLILSFSALLERTNYPSIDAYNFFPLF